MSDERTIAVYDRMSDEYRAMTAADRPGRLLQDFLAQLPHGAAGAMVMDLGCGPGQDAAWMAAAGARVEALDASAAMVAMVRGRNGIEARQATFADVAGEAAARRGTFDGIWASFSLLHAPRGDLPGLLRAFHTLLKPGGLLHVAVKTGEGESRDGLGRLYTYYTVDELVDALSQARFSAIDHTIGRDAKGLSGDVSDWVAILARRDAPKSDVEDRIGS